jgi:hypothetical protein
MIRSLKFTLVILTLLGAVGARAQNFVNVAGGASGSCSSGGSTSSSPPLVVQQGTQTITVNYTMTGAFLVTSVWTIVDVDYQPTCVERVADISSVSPDEVNIKVVTEQGAVLFTDTRQPGTGALSMNECGEELTWTGTYAESIFESRTIDVSALTLSGPLTLFVTTWGCTSNAGSASAAGGVWGTLYGHDLGICGVPSGQAPVVTTKKTSSTSGHVSVDYHFPDDVA